MRDDDIFDRWVDSHNVSDHSWELAGALSSIYRAMSDLLTPEAKSQVLGALRDMDAEAWAGAYGELDRIEQTVGREPADFLIDSLSKIDNLNFEFGAFAHCLYCYASSGMVEPASHSTTLEEQRKWIELWVCRGIRLVAAIPQDLHPLPFFRLIVTGAEGRWALDHEQSITGDQLASLSALAREPGAAATAAFERTRKTVQNLVSEALGKSEVSTLEVRADRMITARTATSWLRAQEQDYFPSTWMIPEPPDTAEDELGSFTFVPVARAYLNVDAKAFSPDARCESGYEIGRDLDVVEDYWEALARLTAMRQPRFRHPGVSRHLGSQSCEDRWLRLPNSEIHRQIEDLASIDRVLEGLTARYVAEIVNDPRFRTHPKAHTKKLFRFETIRNGKALAVEVRKGSPVVYIAKNDADAPLMELGRIVGSDPLGRNSNLNTIDTFKDADLVAIRPKDHESLQFILSKLTQGVSR